MLHGTYCAYLFIVGLLPEDSSPVLTATMLGSLLDFWSLEQCLPYEQSSNYGLKTCEYRASLVNRL